MAGGVAAIGVFRFPFFLRDRSAACLVRCLPAVQVLERFFSHAARGILFGWRRVRRHRRELTSFLAFLFGGLPVADALLFLTHRLMPSALLVAGSTPVMRST